MINIYTYKNIETDKKQKEDKLFNQEKEKMKINKKIESEKKGKESENLYQYNKYINTDKKELVNKEIIDKKERNKLGIEL